MNPDVQNLFNILSVGRAIWVICGGAFLCILIDSLWPKKIGTVIYGVAILTLVLAFVLAAGQWTILIGCHSCDLTACAQCMNITACDACAVMGSQNLMTIDLMTIFFIMLTIFVAIMTLFNALGYLKIHQNLSGEFSALVLFAVVGMIFLFASDHLIVNFIGLETMSLAIYVLVGSHKKNIKSNEAAIKYFIMGGVASAIFLYGIAFFYGAFGTFRMSIMAEMYKTLSMTNAPGLVYLPKLGLAMLMVGIFFKLAIVPFHFWAPDVYEGAPAPVTGFMATGVKVAVFGFAIRIFMSLNAISHVPLGSPDLHAFDMAQVQKLLSIVVVATFVVGNLAAIAQEDIKRMLAYSSISHAGFLLFGIVAGFKDGVYDATEASVVIFYLAGYLFMTLGAFAVLSLLVQEKSEATRFGDLRGLGYRHPVLAGVFGLFMLSLMGFPGTVGFVAKYGIISLAVHNGQIPLTIVAVIASVVSAFYYLRPIAVMFFKNDGARPVIGEIPLTLCFTITFCMVAVLYLGFNPDKYLKFSCQAVSVFQKTVQPGESPLALCLPGI